MDATTNQSSPTTTPAPSPDHAGPRPGAPTGPGEGAHGAGFRSTAPRPDWAPEKFWDDSQGAVRIEDLAKSYLRLESERGNLKTKMHDEAALLPFFEFQRNEAEQARLIWGLQRRYGRAGAVRCVVVGLGR